MDKSKEIKIVLEYDNKKLIAEFPRGVNVDELLGVTLVLIEDVVGSKEVINESIESYYETFIKIENE